MNESIKYISNKLSIVSNSVKATIELLEDGSTVPFISRYRKEATGGLDEVEINDIKNELALFKETEARRSFIIKTIDEQGELTDELKISLEKASELAELEDLYLPYKKKKKTKGTIAKNKGLEPLAELIFEQGDIDLKVEALKFITSSDGVNSETSSEELAVNSIEEALEGTRDIIAEWINEDIEARNKLRTLFEREAELD
ncbi:MAG: Tex-like N-terminal domain-containing protein [Candidatus Dojkabacteria bacterium]|nr:Tex-like N-terminal domain-containing protein [Candidatus Dojkabacteria bacterium]